MMCEHGTPTRKVIKISRMGDLGGAKMGSVSRIGKQGTAMKIKRWAAGGHFDNKMGAHGVLQMSTEYLFKSHVLNEASLGVVNLHNFTEPGSGCG